MYVAGMQIGLACCCPALLLDSSICKEHGMTHTAIGDASRFADSTAVPDAPPLCPTLSPFPPSYRMSHQAASWAVDAVFSWQICAEWGGDRLGGGPTSQHGSQGGGSAPPA